MLWGQLYPMSRPVPQRHPRLILLVLSDSQTLIQLSRKHLHILQSALPNQAKTEINCHVIKPERSRMPGASGRGSGQEAGLPCLHICHCLPSLEEARAEINERSGKQMRAEKGWRWEVKGESRRTLPLLMHSIIARCSSHPCLSGSCGSLSNNAGCCPAESALSQVGPIKTLLCSCLSKCKYIGVY